MTATETLNEGLKRGYELTIVAGTIATKVDEAIAEVAPQVRMPGFRPGKVPANLIRKMHGESLRRDVVQRAISEEVQKLLSDNGLRPAMQPDVEVEGAETAGNDILVKVNLEVLPEVPETDVGAIVLERLTVEAGEADIDAAVERLASGQKSFEEAAAKYKAKSGDLVVMDYAGSIKGKAFEGGTGEAMEIELGSGRLIPGFEEQLTGVKAGDEKTLDVTFPEDYPAKELAGKEAQFAVKVTAVKKPKPVEVNDAFATSLGLENLEQLRGILKDQVEQELNGLTRTYLKRKLLDHLAAAHSFDVPPSMVDAEFDQIWRQVEAEADEEEKAKMEAERDDYRRIAERRVRLGLLLSDLGQKNGVEVTQVEMNRLVAQEAARYRGQEQQVQKFFAENPMAAAQLRAPLFEEKVVDWLLGKASISDRVVTRAELEAAIESEDETPLSAAVIPHGAPGHVHGPDCDHDHHHDHAHHDHDVKPAKKAPAKKAAKAKDAEPAAAAPAVDEASPAAAKPAKKAPAKKAAAKADAGEATTGDAAPAKAPAKKAPAAKKAAK